MRTVTIPEDEYLQIQQSIRDLKNKAELLQDDYFTRKLSLVYQLICEKKSVINETEKVSLKRGAGKGIITYMAEDFDEPLEDFREYME